MLNDNERKLEEFYNSLNEIQRNRVENKLDTILGSADRKIIQEKNINTIRYQIASDMFQLLKG